MKKLLFIYSLLFVSSFANAQSVKQQQDPNRGSFYVTKNSGNVVQTINVNYVLSPGVYTNVLNISMNTPNPMMLSCKITDGNGNALISWMPSQQSNSYNHEFDISNFKPGKYYINVYSDANKKVQTINFEKSASK